MKTKSFLTLALIGCLGAFAAPAVRAQVQYFETISSFTGSLTSFANGKALIQTFSNVTLVDSMTYRFASTSSSFGGTTLNAYFTEWNPATGNAVGSALLSTVINVPSSGSFTDFTGVSDYKGFDYQITLNSVADPSKTYAMVLVGTATTSIGLLNIDGSDAFAYGDSLKRNSGVSSFANLASGGSVGTGGYDWGFSQIAVTPYAGPPSPVPEPHTAAAIFAGLFVAALVGRRMWQRRQLALQPVAA